jgi:hypothetical protein
MVPTGGGFRLMCNRDERAARAAAASPIVRSLGAARAVFPVDPEGNGTWVGANDSGLVLALLNVSTAVTARVEARTRWRSRGLVIPAMLHLADVEAVDVAMKRSDLSSYLPFQLIAARGRLVRRFSWVDGVRGVADVPLDVPQMFTSSSLGDARADALRRPIFERLVLRAEDSWLAGQVRFHEYRDAADPALGVLMDRIEVRTVSCTTVDVDRRGVAMEYQPRVWRRAEVA